jgi:hypothetical protein
MSPRAAWLVVTVIGIGAFGAVIPAASGSATAKVAPTGAATPAASKAGTATVALLASFLEPAGREKFAEQRLDLPLDAKAHETALTSGGSVEGLRLKTVTRDVKVNGAASGVWCELTVLAADGSEAGYLTVVFPKDAAASAVVSASTKFKGAKGVPVLIVLTRP